MANSPHSKKKKTGKARTGRAHSQGQGQSKAKVSLARQASLKALKQVFDGHSFVVSAAGDLVQCLPEFTESLSLTVITDSGDIEPASIAPELSEEESVYKALVLGVRDYVEKNNFNGVINVVLVILIV